MRPNEKSKPIKIFYTVPRTQWQSPTAFKRGGIGGEREKKELEKGKRNEGRALHVTYIFCMHRFINSVTDRKFVDN